MTFRVQGSVYKDGSGTVLARVVSRDGTGAAVAGEGNAVKHGDVSAIDGQWYYLSGPNPALATPLAGTTPAAVIKDTLQTDASWRQDATGYNFAHDVPASVFSATGQYRLRYKVTTTGGAVGWVDVIVTVEP